MLGVLSDERVSVLFTIYRLESHMHISNCCSARKIVNGAENPCFSDAVILTRLHMGIY
jgi:hypothetical protein